MKASENTSYFFKKMAHFTDLWLLLVGSIVVPGFELLLYKAGPAYGLFAFDSVKSILTRKLEHKSTKRKFKIFFIFHF